MYVASSRLLPTAIAKALDTKVYCDSRKAAILRCQSDPDLHALLTTDPLAAGIHLVPLALIASDRLKGYMERCREMDFYGRLKGLLVLGPNVELYGVVPEADGLARVRMVWSGNVLDLDLSKRLQAVRLANLKSLFAQLATGFCALYRSDSVRGGSITRLSGTWAVIGTLSSRSVRR